MKNNGAGLELSRPAPSYDVAAKLGLGPKLGDVLSRRPFLPLDDVELDALTLGEGLEAVAVDCRMMNEAILLSVLGGDEAKTLGVVEPLHFSGGTHARYFLFVRRKCRVAVPIRPVCSRST